MTERERRRRRKEREEKERERGGGKRERRRKEREEEEEGEREKIKTLEQVVVFGTWFSQEGSVLSTLVFRPSKELHYSIKTWELESLQTQRNADYNNGTLFFFFF